ncbi:MAG: efflux RND transporter periplasmic adaptor subunit [Planctomycetota bacterium]
MSDIPHPPSAHPERRRRFLAQGFHPKVAKALALAASGLVLLFSGTAIGYLIAARGGGTSTETRTTTDAGSTVWTCSMHPQIRLPKPGQCPICFMDLIPVEVGGEEAGPRQLRMSETAARLAEIQTTPVRREYATNMLRLVGKVDYDETKLATITAWVPGRLDRLYVDYTGVTVRPGDHMVYLYSPELIVAQQELLRAIESAQRLRSVDDGLSMSTVAAAEEKLRLMGLTPTQIEEIKRQREVSDHLTIYAPIGGVVIEKHANEGSYVQTGTKIYSIADLSNVWVFLEAYESDLPWLRYGQDVEFGAEAYPGEVFHSRISFIDPVLDDRTRTVQVRVSVPNPDGRLKPGMFVRATVHSQVAAGGRVLDPSLAGKWICPMHPEVVKDFPGTCDICGMDLVAAKQLGLVLERDLPAPLVIPDTAPLITGRRAVVYVRLPGEQQPTFEGREVLLGEHAGDKYVVRRGLEEGELVVTSGNFKIDSALEIQAKPSMMRPASTGLGTEGPIDVAPRFHAQLEPVYDAYLGVQSALADDRLADALEAYGSLHRAIVAADASGLDPSARTAWQTAKDVIQPAFEGEWMGEDIEAFRKRFESVASAMLDLASVIGHARATPLYRAFCPMAFQNRGAAWLQDGETIANPYFGHKMLRCGEIQGRFPPVDAAAAAPPGVAPAGSDREVRHEH